MSAPADIRLVAEREVRQRLRGKAFVVSTAAMVAAVLAIGIISRATRDDGRTTADIALLGHVPPGLGTAAVAGGKALDIQVTVRDQPSLASARAALKKGDLDAVIDASRAVLLFHKEEDALLQATLRQAWNSVSVRRSLGTAGLTSVQIDDALSPEPLTTELIEPKQEGEGIAIAVGTISGIVLFLSMQMYGGFILMSVVEEKTTAVIEVLLARVRARDLLAGKVLGMGLVALGQFVLLVAAAFVSLAISGVNVPGAVWSTLPATVVWFVGGFCMYAFLFALAGAMVSRQEDAQAAAVPVQVTLAGAYFSVFALVAEPGSTVARVMSLIPPFTPLVMPIRMAAGKAPVVDIVLALLLVLATVVALTRAAGSIYTKLVLRRGSRVRWMEAVRANS